ncbi:MULTISPECIES: HEPN domain-containing protein [unclassified Enterococcus]|uniref:ApeA N-terminal domain 1-containing protein n=1 Tax=unclassified Enterococcus TaxID=2608891 RepID=UPI00190897A3|nr:MULTISPECIES: HEPN domain-containing protein [unclassified Enterococcus]MBK0036467.1 hypothetical protein [Enterococcus sp. S52]MBK0069130.1 hypothetical protein [Enterococcus sp. S53]MBK0139723.1 hypothetical protein [Enterococcus sp. S76]MBK0143818.1 hypothetical protein [Enterococcus sp. S77]
MKLTLRFSGKTEIKGIEESLDTIIYQNDEKNVNFVHINFYNKEKGRGSSTLLPYFINTMEVTLSNGGKILLVDGQRVQHSSEISYGREVFKYYFDYIIDGASDSLNRFSKVYYKVSGIMKWAQKSNFILSVSKEAKHYIDLSRDTKLLIYESEEYKIEYFVGYIFKSDFMIEEVKLTQKPTIIIESKSPQSIQWFDEKFNQFKTIIELATHKKINYQELSVQEKNTESFSETKDSILVVNSSFSTINNQEENYFDSTNYLFTCTDLLEASDLANWYQKSEKLKPILNLYVEAYYSDASKIENHFLNICQALETYHSRMYTDNKKNYIEVCKKKLNDYPEEWLQFLVRDEKRNKILLSERISDLMFVDNPKYIFSGGFNYVEFPKIISDTRNYYTHYNEKRRKNALEGEELIDAIAILRGILEYHLLRELGFDEEKNFFKINEKFTRIRDKRSYKKALMESDEEKF